MADELKIIHFNTQGFQNKIDNINSFVKVHKPDILVVTEHFQKSADDLENIDGYKMVNSFCRKHNERGGVAIWAKQNVSCRPRKDLDLHRKEKEFELVSVSVGDDVVVTGAYRPPSTSIQDFYNHLEKYTKKINKESHIKHVLAGDFNIDNRKPNKTRTVLNENDLMFNITSKTHRHGRCIDNFITNFKTPRKRVIKSKISDFSDHYPIEIIICNKASMIREQPDSFLNRWFIPRFNQKTESNWFLDKYTGSTKQESSLSVVYDIYSYVFKKISALTTDEPEQSSNTSKTYSNKKAIQQNTEPVSTLNSILLSVTPNWLKSKDENINITKKNKKSNKNKTFVKDETAQEKSFLSYLKHILFSVFNIFKKSSEAGNIKFTPIKTENQSVNMKKSIETTKPSISFFSRLFSMFS